MYACNIVFSSIFRGSEDREGGVLGAPHQLKRSVCDLHLCSSRADSLGVTERGVALDISAGGVHIILFRTFCEA
jgi:hypothetical protein